VAQHLPDLSQRNTGAYPRSSAKPQWAATFGEVVSGIEVAPDGSGFRMKSRFARFTNVPELLRVFHVFGDVKAAEDLNLPTPALASRPGDGERAAEAVVVPSSPELRLLMAELTKRADDIRSGVTRKGEDNMLSIATEGRLAALDLRLVRRSTDEVTKIDVAAERIAGIWREHRGSIYRAPDGSPHPTPGALQIVFADLGTPKPGEWNVYEELRSQLVARGLPRETVRFVHEAANDREKSELFAACRNGQVAVLIGSTERMGVGTNVQSRAVALHHLDCPWRPADIRQREGRILRQGNQNGEVRILRYVTEGSFDGFVWGTVERKAQFIGQVMRGRLDVREIEDIGEVTLSYQEVKALATGNPLLLEQAKADAELARLERLERAHNRNHVQLRGSIKMNEREIEELSARLADTEAAIGQRQDTRGAAFAIVIQGQPTTKRPEAEARLRTALLSLVCDSGLPNGTPVSVGSLGGFPVAASFQRQMTVAPVLFLSLDGVSESALRVTVDELNKTALVTRLENRLTGLEHLRDETAGKIERLRGEIGRSDELLDKRFPHATALAAARGRAEAIHKEIKGIAGDRPADAPATASGPGQGTPLPPRGERRQQWAHRPRPAPPIAPQPRPSTRNNRLMA
jgi:hypothetical protein